MSEDKAILALHRLNQDMLKRIADLGEEIRKLRDQNAILSGALNESNRRQRELIGDVNAVPAKLLGPPVRFTRRG